MIIINNLQTVLCCSLEFHDRHQHSFARDTEPEFHMTLPQLEAYKDVHVGMRAGFAPVTLDRISTYLQQYDKNLDQKNRDMYEQRWDFFW